MQTTIKIEPMGKPRMTRLDKWRQRDCVMRYRAFADELRAQVGPVDQGAFRVDWVAYFTMPASWSMKKKTLMCGTFHRKKPDRDNIDKAILDALFKNDSGIASGQLLKFWDDGGGARIELEIL